VGQVQIGAYNCEVQRRARGAGCDSLHVAHPVWLFWFDHYCGKNVAVAIPPNSPTQLGQWRGTLYVDATARTSKWRR